MLEKSGTSWVWTDVPDEVDSFYVEYDYEVSTLKPYLLMGPKPIAGSDIAAQNGRRYSAKRVRKYGCVNAASRERVIHQRLRSVLEQHLDASQVQFYPMQISTRDGVLHEHYALVPLNEVKCTDIARSDITYWLIPNEAAVDYRSLAFFPNCLGNLPLARDSITGLVVVSNVLKRALEATKEPGLWFEHPEDKKTLIHKYEGLR
jgi:hypothetical protein